MFFFYLPVMCSPTMPEASTPSFSQHTGSGIQGQVVQLSGNYMPGISQSSQQQREAIQTKIWIFDQPIPGTGSPLWAVEAAADHPGLVRQVESDADGHYAVALPPGEYTVFAQQEDYLYLNAFQGDGSFQSVTVTVGQIANLDIVNTENAFF